MDDVSAVAPASALRVATWKKKASSWSSCCMWWRPTVGPLPSVNASTRWMRTRGRAAHTRVRSAGPAAKLGRRRRSSSGVAAIAAVSCVEEPGGWVKQQKGLLSEVE